MADHPFLSAFRLNNVKIWYKLLVEYEIINV